MGVRVGEGRLPSQPELADDFECAVDNNGAYPRRRMFRAIPEAYVPGTAPICLDSNDPATIVDGVKSRLFRKRPTISPSRLGKFKSFVRRWVKQYLSPLETVMSFEEWIESAPYSGQRKTELRRTYDEIKGHCPSKASQRISSFIKTEGYPEFKHARPINSRCDQFKVFTGPYFKQIEKSVFGLKWFIKHVPVAERPIHLRKLEQFGRKYVASDYSAYEGSFLPEILMACECILYRYMLGNFPGMADFICSVISGKNVLHFRRGVSVSTLGHRMSGDMCTSLGNGFTNLMVWFFLMEEMGVSENEWEGFVEGDDGIFAYPDYVSVSESLYEDLGFIVKLQHVASPEDASFCGIIGVDGQNLRNPFEFAQNFGWTSTDIGARPAKLKSLLRAKALSAVYETPQCPIVRSYAQWALKHTRGCVPKFVEDGYHDTSAIPRDEKSLSDFNPSDRVRERFHALFGIPACDQIRLEKAILKFGPSVLTELAVSKPVSDYWLAYTEYG